MATDLNLILEGLACNSHALFVPEIWVPLHNQASNQNTTRDGDWVLGLRDSNVVGLPSTSSSEPQETSNTKATTNHIRVLVKCLQRLRVLTTTLLWVYGAPQLNYR
eukprot:4240991-Amphidinium_carterae.1